ncbi:hypothetical protein MKX01_023442 [Papaver californicum]|nr:hypothetical protein MKX01_023442 [Papaver californicum]
MAKKCAVIILSVFFLVLFIFIQGGSKAVMIKDKGNTCKEKWEAGCAIDKDCQEKCFRDHGKEAKPRCVVRSAKRLPNLCECKYTL